MYSAKLSSPKQFSTVGLITGSVSISQFSVQVRGERGEGFCRHAIRSVDLCCNLYGDHVLHRVLCCLGTSVCVRVQMLADDRVNSGGRAGWGRREEKEGEGRREGKVFL